MYWDGVIVPDGRAARPRSPLPDRRAHSPSFWEGCRLSAPSGNYPPLKSTACPGQEPGRGVGSCHPMAFSDWSVLA